MGEVWVAAVATVAAGAISGYGQQKKAKEDRKNANEDRRAATREEALYGGVLSQFEREQDDYYNQLERQRKQRGLDTFKQFSTLREYNPNYMPSPNEQITLPDRPNMANSLDAAIRQDEANQLAAQQQATGTAPQKRGGGSIVKKLVDPLGIF